MPKKTDKSKTKKPRKTITKKSKDGKVIQTVNIYTGKGSGKKKSTTPAPVRQVSTTELLLTSLLRQQQQPKTDIYNPSSFMMYSNPPKKETFETPIPPNKKSNVPDYEKKRPISDQYATKERKFFQDIGNKKTPIVSDFTSGETTDVYSYKKNIFPKQPVKAFDTETEVEGYVPIKPPSYAFGKQTTQPPLNIAPSLSNINNIIDTQEKPEEIVSLPIETTEEPKVVRTGETFKIRRKTPKKKLDLIIEDEDNTEEIPSVQKKKPLSKMNKSELQDEYRSQFKEEPNKALSKKDLYEILK